MIIERNYEEKVEALGVSWGHYVEKSIPTDVYLGTDSLASCFAFIRIDKATRKVFFAHVSNDGETQFLIDKNFSTSKMFGSPDEEIQYLYVKGSAPNENTEKRIKSLTEKYKGDVYEKKDRSGVALSPFKQSDVKIVITHCKEILATNKEVYKEKTKLAEQWKQPHGLESM